MSQIDVLRVLKKRDDWLSVDTIAKELKIEKGSVARALNSMFKYGEVLRRRVKKEDYWLYEWRYKEY